MHQYPELDCTLHKCRLSQVYEFKIFFTLARSEGVLRYAINEQS